jgi:intracellular septation protein
LPGRQRSCASHEASVRLGKIATARHGFDVLSPCPLSPDQKHPTSVLLAIALGAAQIGWQIVRKQPIDTMQWMSLFLVLGSGAITLMTNDPRFVMVKPSVIYVIVGIVMLKHGWINRYLPPAAIELVPDIATIFGYVWAGLMFFSAGLNLIVALNFNVVTWSASMSIYAIVSKAALFLIGYATMRTIALRRRRARMAPALS